MRQTFYFSLWSAPQRASYKIHSATVSIHSRCEKNPTETQHEPLKLATFAGVYWNHVSIWWIKKKEIHRCRMCRNDSPSSIIHRYKVWTVLTTFTRVIDTSRMNDNRSRWENQRTLVYWTWAMSVGWKVHQLALNIQFNCGCFRTKVKFFQKYEVHKSRSGVVGQNDPGYQKNLITSNNRLRKINIQEIYERGKKQCLWGFSCLTYIQ